MTELFLNLTGISTIFCAILAITASSPVSIIVYLIGVFIISACYLLLLGLGFIGLSYLIVYVGAVAVLFLFVVIILNIRLSDITTTGLAYTQSIPLGFIIGLVFLFEIISVISTSSSYIGQLFLGIFHTINTIWINIDISSSSFEIISINYITPIPDSILVGNITQVQALGNNLYGHGALWLIITSFILLLAIIGPISLCLRPLTNITK